MFIRGHLLLDSDVHRTSRLEVSSAHVLDFGGRINEAFIMVIDMPKHIEARLTSEKAALNLALGLYASNEISLGQGARIAKLSVPEFMKELGQRKIPAHYRVEDLEQDLKSIEKYFKK
jgi:predicted HTH domain antitoxin